MLVSHVHVQVPFVREHFSTFAAQTLGRRAFLLPVYTGHVIPHVLLVFKPFIALGALMGFVHFLPAFSQMPIQYKRIGILIPAEATFVRLQTIVAVLMFLADPSADELFSTNVTLEFVLSRVFAPVLFKSPEGLILLIANGALVHLALVHGLYVFLQGLGVAVFFPAHIALEHLAVELVRFFVFA